MRHDLHLDGHYGARWRLIRAQPDDPGPLGDETYPPESRRRALATIMAWLLVSAIFGLGAMVLLGVRP